MTIAWLRELAFDGFLLEAALIVLVAPLLGVTSFAPRSRRATASNAQRKAVLSAAVLAGVLSLSAISMLAICGSAEEGVAPILASHITLTSAAAALFALGAFCAATFADDLDAAAIALLVALLTATGFVVAGPALRDFPTSGINAALLASPVASSASAAGIDLLRSYPFYILTPIAHRQFSYPAWYTASGCYLVVGTLCFCGVLWNARAAHR